MEAKTSGALRHALTIVVAMAIGSGGCSSGSATDGGGHDGSVPSGGSSDASLADTAQPGGASDGGAADATQSGPTSEAGGPVFLSFGRSQAKLTEGETVTFTAVLTDPDGIDDLIGGTLRSPDGMVSYGAFISSGQEGSYSLTLSFSALAKAGANFFSSDQRTVVAEFFDVSGKRATAQTDVSLSCGFGRGVCSGACVEHVLTHTTSSQPSLDHQILALSSDGTTVYGAGDVLVRREPSGQWTEESVPATVKLAASSGWHDLYNATNGDLWFRFRPYGAGYDLLATRQGGTWMTTPWDSGSLLVHAGEIYRYGKSVERQLADGSWVDDAHYTAASIQVMTERGGDLFAGAWGAVLRKSAGNWSIESPGIDSVSLLGASDDRLFAVYSSEAAWRSAAGTWTVEPAGLVAGIGAPTALWVSNEDVFVAQSDGVYHAFTGKPWTLQLAVSCRALARVGQRLICLATLEKPSTTSVVWEADVALPCN